MKYATCLLTVLLLFSSCGGKKNKDTGTVSQVRKLEIEVPQPPAMMTDQGERAAWLARHFWDNMNFSDTAYINKPEITEQALSEYIMILNYIPQDAAIESMDDLMDRAKADSSMYAYFADRAEYYLYHPNSPMRNEELYIPVLQNILEWEKTDELVRIRPAAQLEMALKNRVGHPATDFSLTLADGTQTTLYDVKGEFLLLFFIDTDCSGCAAFTAALRESPTINLLTEAGVLKILTVYPYEHIDRWREYQAELPSSWVNGYDARRRILGERLYDMRATPTIYLLDGDKNIVIKDVMSVEMLEYFFAPEGTI